jgi:hypothetical protein
MGHPVHPMNLATAHGHPPTCLTYPISRHLPQPPYCFYQAKAPQRGDNKFMLFGIICFCVKDFFSSRAARFFYIYECCRPITQPFSYLKFISSCYPVPFTSCKKYCFFSLLTNLLLLIYIVGGRCEFAKNYIFDRDSGQ